MTLRLEALIEHWPSERLLFVRALPGFQVSAPTSAELKARSAAALQNHLDWLVERELIDQPSGDVELSVVEDVHVDNGSIGPRFLADLAVPDEEEVELALAVGRAAISDLIEAHEEASQRGLHTDPDAVLRHVARLDRWYAERLSGRPSEAGSRFGDEVDELVSAAGEFEDSVDAFVVGGERELFARDGEEWTLAKTLRRRTGHLREHLADLAPAAIDG